MVDLAPLRRGFFVRWAETRTVCAWAYSQAGSRFVSEARDRVTGGGGARPPAGAARLPCAVCNRLCGLAFESAGLLSQPARASPAYEAKLSPASAGLFLRAARSDWWRMRRTLVQPTCGAALGWRACVRERSASPVMARHMTHLAPLAGLLFGDPCPTPLAPCGCRRSPAACDYVALASRRNTGRILTERYRGFRATCNSPSPLRPAVMAITSPRTRSCERPLAVVSI